jgi:hypothetical protein
MSTTHAPVPATHGEEQGLPYKMLVLVGALTLGVFALGIVWSTYLLNANIAITQPDPQAEVEAQKRIEQEVDQPEIGIVNQRMFELDARAQEKRELQMRRLNSYGWVDKDKQLAHIPIERAMQLYLSEQKK